MPKIITAEQIEKMKSARLEKIKNSNGLIWNIGDGIEIHADKFQFILRMPGEPDQHYHFNDMDEIIKDLFYKHSVNLMIKDKRKTIEGVAESFLKSKKWLDNVLTPILSPFSEPKS